MSVTQESPAGYPLGPAKRLPIEAVRRVLCAFAEAGIRQQVVEDIRQTMEENFGPDRASDTEIGLQGIVTGVEQAVRNAVRYGLIFDLGRIVPTAFEDLYQQAYPFSEVGKLPHPDSRGYAFTLDCGSGSQIYLVTPLPDVHGYVAAELTVYGVGCALAAVGIIPENIKDGFGLGLCVPVFWAQANVHDLALPVAAFRMLLSTRGVPVERIAAPEKLNKARAKLGRAPVPGYWLVDPAGRYATALRETRRMEREDRGGTHASPRPHLRRGHIRHLSETRTTVVRSAIVGFKDSVEINSFMRTHYDLTRPPGKGPA